MTGFHQVTIGGYPSGGLVQDRKPLLLPDEAYSTLQNAYVWRQRTKKRDGDVSVGRLTHAFTNAAIGPSGGVPGVSPWSFNLYTVLGITPDPNSEIYPGSVQIAINTVPTPFLDQGNGILTNVTAGNSGTINYVTGDIVIITTTTAGHAATINFNYASGLPVMGIIKRELISVGIEQTVFFDRKYAYIFNAGGFQELPSTSATTWTGSNRQFFWGTNFQGATADLRYFYVTNDNITKGMATPYDPIRYYDGSTWNDLQPLLTATTTLWQALILIPYYGRLLALNTWEGSTGGGPAGATNFFTRCRFSQIGDPTDATNGWRSDIFGRGGFLDAPTNEQIVSVAFHRNTLIVFFEYSVWQLRYIGEYGIPFIFERISSDFGCSSTFSPVIFDQGVLAIGDRGIIQAGAHGVSRIDEQIPEQVFSFEVGDNDPNFVHGIRDFERELVYWNYVDSTTPNQFQDRPNTVLVYNYRNDTWATFRDNITCFGLSQFPFSITWDSLTTFWESTASWDNVDDQVYVDYVTGGTQLGFIIIYQNPEAETPIPSPTMYAQSLAITAVTFQTVPMPVILRVPNHNLFNGELIYIENTAWSPSVDPGFNNNIFQVTVIGFNEITLSKWSQATQSYSTVSIAPGPTYLGAGRITLLPRLNIVGKDFNPFQQLGKQFKLSYIDFQMDSSIESPALTAVTVQLFVNSYLGEQANVITSNQEVLNSSQPCNFITAAFQTNPCQITSPGHSILSGTQIYISNVQGMTQLNAAIYTITVVDSNNFTLNGIDATGFSTYTGGGVWNTTPANGQQYISGSQYAWYRFYSTQFGQYLRIALTYDDILMNQLATHQTTMELNAMNVWFREGGRLMN